MNHSLEKSCSVYCYLLLLGSIAISIERCLKLQCWN